MIDPRAIIHPSAELGANVHVGAWSVVGEEVVIGDGVRLASQVVVQAGTLIGERSQIGPQVVIGDHPLAPSTLNEIGTELGAEQRTSTRLTLGSDCTVCAMSRVLTSVAAGDTVAGNPAQSLKPST